MRRRRRPAGLLVIGGRERIIERMSSTLCRAHRDFPPPARSLAHEDVGRSKRSCASASRFEDQFPETGCLAMVAAPLRQHGEVTQYGMFRRLEQTDVMCKKLERRSPRRKRGTGSVRGVGLRRHHADRFDGNPVVSAAGQSRADLVAPCRKVRFDIPGLARQRFADRPRQLAALLTIAQNHDVDDRVRWRIDRSIFVARPLPHQPLSAEKFPMAVRHHHDDRETVLRRVDLEGDCGPLLLDASGAAALPAHRRGQQVRQKRCDSGAW